MASLDLLVINKFSYDCILVIVSLVTNIYYVTNKQVNIQKI